MNANAKVTEDNKVKITGLTRRVDSLGRIVIPKELRRMLHIKEGSPLEIYMDADETIVLKKYFTGICTEPVKGNRCHGMCGRPG